MAFLGSKKYEKHENPPTAASASPAPRLISVRCEGNTGRHSSKLEEETKNSGKKTLKLCGLTVDFPEIKAQNTAAMRNRSSRSGHQK